MLASGRKQGRVELQSRDHELLVGLFESRLMTLDQAARLYFAGRPEAAKKRIQQLKAAGYIGARPRRPTEPSILYITRLGFQAVSDRGLPPHYPPLGWEALERRRAVSDSTLRHELAVMEVKAVLCATIAASPRLRVVEFSTWPVLFEFIARRRDPLAGALRDVPVRPDGFIRVHEEERDGGVSEHTFFLELDRSNEAQRSRFVPNAGSYADYYRRGGLAVAAGLDPVGGFFVVGLFGDAAAIVDRRSSDPAGACPHVLPARVADLGDGT